MREILFRGKRLDNDEWVEGGLVQKADSLFGAPSYFIVGQGCSTVMLDSFCTWRIVDPDTVGQYTGLTDKNGKKIFEGDVLRYYSDYRNEFMGAPCIAWYGEFNCTCCDGVYGWYFEGGDIRDHNLYVVIGNIHDNPELAGGDADAAD